MYALYHPIFHEELRRLDVAGEETSTGGAGETLGSSSFASTSGSDDDTSARNTVLRNGTEIFRILRKTGCPDLLRIRV